MDPILTPAIIAGGLQGVSAVGKFFAGRQQARQQNEAKAQEYRQQLQIQKRQYEDANQLYATRLGRYNTQLREFDRAAALGYSREQLRQNEAFKQAMFGTQDNSIQLARMQGQGTATGVSGKSAARIGNDSLAAFGRNQAKIAESLFSGQLRYGQNVQDIRNRLESARNNAYSKVAIAPRKPVPLMAPYQSKGPSGFSLLSDLASAAATGYGTYTDLNAPNPFPDPNAPNPFPDPNAPKPIG